VRQAFTKENSSCYVFVNVKFSGVLKFAGTAKIRGLTLFRNVNVQQNTLLRGLRMLS